MAVEKPVRRAGYRIGLDGKCPLPSDGLSNPQNTARRQYTSNEGAGTCKQTNESNLPWVGVGSNVGDHATERANEEAIRTRNEGLDPSQKGRQPEE